MKSATEILRAYALGLRTFVVDSADVVARRYPLPRLREGDPLLSHAIGADTAVSAATFNGRRPARVIVRDPVTAPRVAD